MFAYCYMVPSIPTNTNNFQKYYVDTDEILTSTQEYSKLPRNPEPELLQPIRRTQNT